MAAATEPTPESFVCTVPTEYLIPEVPPESYEQNGPNFRASSESLFGKVKDVVSNVQQPRVNEYHWLAYMPMDIEARPAAANERACSLPPDGFKAFNGFHIRAGLQYPFPQLLTNITLSAGVALCQLPPNSISSIIAFCVRCLQVNVTPYGDLFTCFFKIRMRDGYCETYTQGRPLFGGLPNKVHFWKNGFFFIRGSEQPQTVPYNAKWGHCKEGFNTAPKRIPGLKADIEKVQGDLTAGSLLDVSLYTSPEVMAYYGVYPRDFTPTQFAEVKDFCDNGLYRIRLASKEAEARGPWCSETGIHKVRHATYGGKGTFPLSGQAWKRLLGLEPTAVRAAAGPLPRHSRRAPAVGIAFREASNIPSSASSGPTIAAGDKGKAPLAAIPFMVLDRPTGVIASTSTVCEVLPPASASSVNAASDFVAGSSLGTSSSILRSTVPTVSAATSGVAPSTGAGVSLMASHTVSSTAVASATDLFVSASSAAFGAASVVSATDSVVTASTSAPTSTVPPPATAGRSLLPAVYRRLPAASRVSVPADQALNQRRGIRTALAAGLPLPMDRPVRRRLASPSANSAASSAGTVSSSSSSPALASSSSASDSHAARVAEVYNTDPEILGYRLPAHGRTVVPPPAPEAPTVASETQVPDVRALLTAEELQASTNAIFGPLYEFQKRSPSLIHAADLKLALDSCRGDPYHVAQHIAQSLAMTLAIAQTAESDKRELAELRRAKEEYIQTLAQKDEELAKKNEDLAKKDEELARSKSDVDRLKGAQASLSRELTQVKTDVLSVPVLHQRVQTLTSEVAELQSELAELRESSYLAEEKANDDIDQANRKLTEAENRLAEVEDNNQMVVANLEKDLELSRAQCASAVDDWLLSPNIHYAVRNLYGYYYAAGFSACREIVHEVSPDFDLQLLRLNGQERFLANGETLLIRPEVDRVKTAPVDFNFDQPLALAMIFPEEFHPDEVPFLEDPADGVLAHAEEDQAQANEAELPAPGGEEDQLPADNV